MRFLGNKNHVEYQQPLRLTGTREESNSGSKQPQLLCVNPSPVRSGGRRRGGGGGLAGPHLKPDEARGSFLKLICNAPTLA